MLVPNIARGSPTATSVWRERDPTDRQLDVHANMGCPVTIITPTLNTTAYLDNCLTTSREQGVVGLEHLVVDGGSTDATIEIATTGRPK